VLATSTAVAHGQRLDWTASAQTEYYVRMIGDAQAVDLRVANLLQKVGNALTVHGTAGDDTFHFAPSASQRIVVNGVEYHFTNDEPNLISFDGGHGTDTVVLEDTPGDEVLTSGPGHASYVNVDGKFELGATGFEVLHAYARNGGHDTADLHDSPGFDKFKSVPVANYAKVYGGQLYHRVKFYEMVEVHSQGGGDLARLFDSAVNDIFEGHKDRSAFRNHTTEVLVHHFQDVIAYAGQGGHDIANFLPSDRKDEFHGKPNKAEFFDQVTGGELYRIMVRGYDEHHAAGTPDGGDKAKLWDSIHDALLSAVQEGATFSLNAGSLDRLYEVLAFDMVKANGFNGGTNKRDVADLLNWDLLFDGEWE